jgi:hypothetical protein
MMEEGIFEIIDGQRKRKLRFGYQCVVFMEDRLDKGVWAIMKHISTLDEFRMSMIKLGVEAAARDYCLLSSDEVDFSDKDVNRWMSENSLFDLIAVVQKGFEGAFKKNALTPSENGEIVKTLP